MRWVRFPTTTSDTGRPEPLWGPWLQVVLIQLERKRVPGPYITTDIRTFSWTERQGCKQTKGIKILGILKSPSVSQSPVSLKLLVEYSSRDSSQTWNRKPVDPKTERRH